MLINLHAAIGVRLYLAVKEKFSIERKDKLNTIPEKEETFWKAVDPFTGKNLFEANFPAEAGIKYIFLYKKILHESPSEASVTENDGTKKSYSYWGFQTKKLQALLDYLDCEGESISLQLQTFCKKESEKERSFEKVNEKLKVIILMYSEITEDVWDLQFNHILRGVAFPPQGQAATSAFDIYNLSSINIDHFRKLLIPKFKNTNWYLYIYDDDKYRASRTKNTWLLVRLVLRFLEESNGEINIKILNTKSSAHENYIGRTEFNNSSGTILAIIGKTEPNYSRLLNLRINIGTGEKEEGQKRVYLGQYLNQESDSHIVGGTLVLEEIEGSNSEHILASEVKVFPIPKLSDGAPMYDEDHFGISRYILQYLHEKEKNFRRTPLRSKYSLEDLGFWLKDRLMPDNDSGS